MLNKLIVIANVLDKKGLYKEADMLDHIIRMAKEGIPPFQYDELKKCIDEGMSYEECKKHIPSLTKENYNEMKGMDTDDDPTKIKLPTFEELQKRLREKHKVPQPQKPLPPQKPNPPQKI